MYAASGLNQAELQVLETLEKGAKYDKDFYQYRNALKIYFNRDNITITQIQADTAHGLLIDFYDNYDPEAADIKEKTFDTLLYVLMYLNVRVIYDRASSTADLVGSDGSIVMSDIELDNLDSGRAVTLNPIKRTGTDSDSYIILILSASAMIMAVGAIVFYKNRKERVKFNGR